MSGIASSPIVKPFEPRRREEREERTEKKDPSVFPPYSFAFFAPSWFNILTVVAGMIACGSIRFIEPMEEWNL